MSFDSKEKEMAIAEELLRQIQAKAAACRTAREAKILRDQTPVGSTAANIYSERLLVLEEEELATEVASATTVDELLALLENDLSYAQLTGVLIPRLKLLAKAEAAACQTAEAAFESSQKFLSAGKHRDILLHGFTILDKRRKQLAAKEAPAKAAACQEAGEAKALVQSDIYQGCERALSRFYNRWCVLANAEAPAKAKGCRSYEEASRFFIEAPVQSLARNRIYLPLMKKMATKEAPANAAACQRSAEARKYYEDTHRECKVAREIYEQRWTELHLAGR